MSQSSKPTTNVNTFVPEYWVESGGLDIGYANSHYLRFPVGQGQETFTNLIVSGNSTLGTTTASSLTSSGNITAPNFVGNTTTPSTTVINRQINFPNKTTSLAKQTIEYTPNSTSTIQTRNVIANLPVGSSAQYQNTFTFGKSIPPITLLGGSGINTVAYSTDNGLTYNGLGWSVFNVSCYSIVWNGSIWVAGGENTPPSGGASSSIAWSNDGFVWNIINTNLMGRVYNIVWDGQKFVAVGSPYSTYSIMYSYDGQNWVGTSTVFVSYGLGIAWNGNIFVAGGRGTTNTLATSPDGINWTGRGKTVFTDECYDFAWNGTLFVGVGNSQLAYSYDAISWVVVSPNPLSNGRSVAWNGTMFVAGGAGASQQLAYSFDGIVWIDITGYNLVGGVYGISWNGTVWNAGGVGTDPTAISYDGINWISLNLGGIFTALSYKSCSNRMREHTITFPTNRTVIGGDGTNTIAYSDDEGATWTGLGNIIFTTARAFCSNGSVWVGAGSGLNTLAWSYDAVSWVGLGLTVFSGTCYSIIWTGSLFFAVGQGVNFLATSPNGTAWTGYGVPLPFATAIFDIAYNGSIYVACGTGGVIAYSTTGTSGWTAVSPSIFSTDAFGIEWNGSMFVAVGQGSVNTIAHSFDGINWTGQGRSIFTTAGRTVAWNGSVWVVGGSSGGAVVAYSKTGLSWTLGTAGGTPLIRFNSIGWNGTRFIGLGQGGQSVSSSPDGVNWTSYGSTVFSTAGHSFASNINQSAVAIKQNILILGRTGTSDVMYYSLDDGVNWTAMRTTTMITNCSGLLWNGYVWIAGGLGTNSLSYSYNGQNWVGISGVLNDNGRGIGWNGNRLVAVGSNTTTNNVAYSNNGINWTSLNVNSINFGWRCVAGNSSGTWVIGGQGTNSLAYSTNNGLTWTTLTGGGALPVWALGIIWTGTKFIVVANGTAMVYTSTNGSTWTAITNISNFSFGVCVATNGNIVVAGGVGTLPLAYSRDQGATWTSVSSSGSVFQAITSITWTGTRFVACGNRISGGTGIYSSIDGITWSAPTATTFTNTDAIISSGIGITPDNSFQLTNPNTQLDVVAPNYFNQGYSNCSISISQS